MSGQLDPSDLVGMSFWIISAAMVAATFFFWVERDRAVGKWKTSLTVAAMVTGIAAIHYFYMRDVWADTGESPLVFRYVDWLLTVPLQILFNFSCYCSRTIVIILEIIDSISSNVSGRLPWGSRFSKRMGRLRYRYAWLALYYL